jgi:4-oxalocrotonate tautomerase
MSANSNAVMRAQMMRMVR